MVTIDLESFLIYLNFSHNPTQSLCNIQYSFTGKNAIGQFFYFSHENHIY